MTRCQAGPVRLLFALLAFGVVAAVPTGGAQAVSPGPAVLTGYLTWNAQDEFGLSWNPNAPSVDPGGAPPGPDVAGARSLQEGVLAPNLRRTTGEAVFLPPDDVFRSDPIPFDVRLDGNRTVVLDLYLWQEGRDCQNPSTVTVPQPESYPQVEVTIHVGTRFVTGGTPISAMDPFPKNPAPPFPMPAGYCRIKMLMPPELDWLRKGEKLDVVIRHVNQPDYYRFGTAGLHRSILQIPYFGVEELVFREPQVFDFPDDENSAQMPGDPVSEILGALGSVPMAAVAVGGGLARGRHRGVAVLMSMFFALGFAGCVNPKDASDEAARQSTAPSTLGASYVTDPASAIPEGYGAIAGRVLDDLGMPIFKARVSLLGTTNFTDTTPWGSFSFGRVPAGIRELIIVEDPIAAAEKATYHPLRTFVVVKAKTLARVEATLLMIDPPAGDYRPHRHDYWNQATSKVLHEGSQMLRTPVGPAFCQPAVPETCGFPNPTQTRCTTSISYPPRTVCDQMSPRFTIPPGPDDSEHVIVLPGTQEIQVVLDWPADATLDRVGVAFRPAFARLGFNEFLYLYPKSRGEIHHLRTEWETTDRGHQWGTRWEFAFYIPGHDANTVEGLSAEKSMPPVDFEVTIHRGTIPIEAPHPNFWNGTNSYEIGSFQGTITCNILNQPPASQVCNNKNTIAAPRKLILLETRWIDARINFSAPLHKPYYFELKFTTPLGRTGTADFKACTEDGLIYYFRFPIAANEPDTPYDPPSKWNLAITNATKTTGDDRAAQGRTYTVQFNAHRSGYPDAQAGWEP